MPIANSLLFIVDYEDEGVLLLPIPNVRQEFLKLYVAFKLDTNFVDVVPQASGIKLSLNCKFTEIHDPKNPCRNVTNLGRWGNGDVEIKISKFSDIPYAIQLIQQVVDMQVEG